MNFLQASDHTPSVDAIMYFLEVNKVYVQFLTNLLCFLHPGPYGKGPMSCKFPLVKSTMVLLYTVIIIC